MTPVEAISMANQSNQPQQPQRSSQRDDLERQARELGVQVDPGATDAQLQQQIDAQRQTQQQQQGQQQQQ